MKKPSSSPPTEARPYRSTMRKQQADATRERIVDAARTLLLTRGFDGTTIDAIAKEAGVATPTVYATFGSKRGIVAELLEKARFGEGYRRLVEEARATDDPVARVRFAAAIARQIYDSERAELDILRAAGGVSPELAEMDRDRECRRYESQGPLVASLVAAKRLRAGLDAAEARDVLWALTNRESYRLLVVERGWSADAYQSWLADLLESTLLRPASVKKATPRRRR